MTHLEILGGVAGELENLGGEVLCEGGGSGVRRWMDEMRGKTTTLGRRAAGFSRVRKRGVGASRDDAPRMAAE